MAIKKEKKKEIIADLEKAVRDSKSIVFVNFHGLTVSQASLIRRALRNDNIGYKVAKKTLIRRALGTGNIIGELPPLLGELALVYGEDSIAPAQGIYQFEKKLDGKVKIIGGIFEGAYVSGEKMVSIASIPGMPVLRGMFVNIVNSPIQRFVIVLNEVAKIKN